MATSGDTPEKAPNPRRRLSATGKVGLLILAVAVLFWADQVWRAWRIHELMDAGNTHPVPVSLGPSWMRTRFGDAIVAWLYAKPNWLIFDGTPDVEVWCDRLGDVPDLKELGFRKSSFGDDGLRYLEPLKALQWLYFDDCPAITDSALPRIAQHKALQLLSLKGTSITDAGLPALTSLPFLGSLDLDDTAVTDAGIVEIARIPSLQKVCLGSSKGAGYTPLITARGLRELARRPGISLIHLANVEMTDEVVEALLEFPELKGIWLSCPHATSDEVRRLARLPNLYGLYRLGPTVGDESVDSLLEMKSLQWLVLDGTRITDEGLTRLATVSNLGWLSLNGTRITAAGLGPLAGSRKLIELNLNDTPVGDEIVDLLLALPALRTVRLAGTGITDAGLLRLAKLRGLIGLDLSRTMITPAGVALLRSMPNLSWISVDDVPLMDADLEAFIAAHPPWLFGKGPPPLPRPTSLPTQKK